mmetsp:Transcript_20644/g.24438  ORF Transcript_20644/g.24438 Transcript_20644/m.24438 type:complete len:669 (-) Transcript_20644:123-2129(-)
MWLWGGNSVERNRSSSKDRPPLSSYLDKLLTRETSNVSNETHTNMKHNSLASSFLVVPLETIGKRADHNADICSSVINFYEERTRQLQKSLKEMRKKSPIIPLQHHTEFNMGTLEKALAELNRIHESEAMQVNGRVADLELRLRQTLSRSRENAVGCGVDYEAEIHKVERDTQKAREKLQKSKSAQQRAVERLASIHAKSYEPPPTSLLSAVRSSRQLSDADQASEILEANEQLEAAINRMQEDCEQLLICVRKQDQVIAAAALGFEGCDIRCREALSTSLKVFVDIEIEAASKRLQDLSKLSTTLSTINIVSDSKAFVDSAKRPDLTHSSSAALSLLHDPDNRGALIGQSALKPTQEKGCEVDSKPIPVESLNPLSAVEDDDDGEPSPDHTLASMERIVKALFVSKPKQDPVPVSENVEHNQDTLPLHPLQLSSSESDRSVTGPLLTAHEARRFTTLLQKPEGREALVHALNQQRSRRTEIEDGFEELCEAMSVVLDKCRENRDVHTAKMAMMLSQTFYREPILVVESNSLPTGTRGRAESSSGPSRKGREYLKSALISHPLWEDMSFWDEACWQSIRESVKEGRSDVAWHDMTPLEQRDSVLRIHNIVFSQVGAYAHSMLEFGCKPSLARMFMLRLASTYELAEDQKDMLLALLDGLDCTTHEESV